MAEIMFNEERSGQSTIVTDKLVAKVDVKIQENRLFTITELLFSFPQISQNWLHEINKLRKGMTNWLKSQVAEFYDGQISKFVCYDKCLNLYGAILKSSI